MQIDTQLLKKRLFTDSNVENIKFFPGANRDATPEDFASEINKYFADAETHQECLDPDTDLDG
ncbi:hypothetical protein [Hyphobacterium indicum]|uniref:hypothetical protein n=1 Tax=Hyphobacterium indicum TaxID=2162714 RepID=UPI000D65C5C5|nr:hypothetical protein [Hyphobacterium indicum]